MPLVALALTAAWPLVAGMLPAAFRARATSTSAATVVRCAEPRQAARWWRRVLRTAELLVFTYRIQVCLVEEPWSAASTATHVLGGTGQPLTALGGREINGGNQ